MSAACAALAPGRNQWPSDRIVELSLVVYWLVSPPAERYTRPRALPQGGGGAPKGMAIRHEMQTTFREQWFAAHASLASRPKDRVSMHVATERC